MPSTVRDYESCRLATTDPGDPDVGLPSARVCSWTGQLCGGAEGAPRVCDCPRFEDVSGAPCPDCGGDLRHDPEYNLYACPECPEAWYLGQRELFRAYRVMVARFQVAANGQRNAREALALTALTTAVMQSEEWAGIASRCMAAPGDYQAALVAGAPPGALVDTGGVQNGGGAA